MYNNCLKANTIIEMSCKNENDVFPIQKDSIEPYKYYELKLDIKHFENSEFVQDLLKRNPDIKFIDACVSIFLFRIDKKNEFIGRIWDTSVWHGSGAYGGTKEGYTCFNCTITAIYNNKGVWKSAKVEILDQLSNL